MTTTTTTGLVPGYLDVTRLAVGSFLARYREPTLTAYTQDLRAFLGWCQTYDREVLRVTRGELELYVRHLESRGYAAATVARRFGTVATFYKYAVIDGVIPANPAVAVSRPKVAWEGQKRTVLHPLEFAALLAAARSSVRTTTRWSACSGCSGCGCRRPAPPTSLTCATRPATSCCTCSVEAPSRPTSRCRSRCCGRSGDAVDGRSSGPILRTRSGRRMDRAGASRALTRVAHAAGITRKISPHGLRRTFCTTGLVAGISLRDMQYAMRHTDPRTTMRYDMAKANLDRHAAHAVAAYLAGMSTG